jgi:threonylcarbamoyladenosine tRNA methylthiotransferase MtaB
MKLKQTIAFHTLGCKLNFSETATLAQWAEKEGFEKKNFEEAADVYVINTCSVTDNADKECRQIVRRVQKKSPESTIVIMGCYAQLKPKEIASIPGVSMVLGAAEKFNLFQHLKNFNNTNASRICSCDIQEVRHFYTAASIHERTRTFLKVQDGCDYNCSFCTIPLARGKSRSNTIEGVLTQVKKLEEKGVKEIVLTGINLGDFGKGLEGNKIHKENFFQLIEALELYTNIPRYRISSIEPNLVSNEIINYVAVSKKIMPHFHIPLQSGSNRILAAMQRRYKRELYAEKLNKIITQIPLCGIGADVITGFPGETEDDFQETFSFLEGLPVSYLHVFTYSERANTKAIAIQPSVPLQTRHERTRLLRQLSHRKMEEFIRKNAGTKRKVLFEECNKEGMMEGYTDNYIRITALYKKEWANEVIDWPIT